MHIVGRFKREDDGRTLFKEIEEFLMASDRGVATKTGGDMTADLEEMARRELGETPEVKAKCIGKLRRLLSEESRLECPTDEEFLVKFLRARKYDVEEAFKNIRKYFRVKQETREMFDNLNPYSVPFDSTCRQHRLVTVSRQRDSLGRGVVLLRLGAWNSRMCSLNDYFRVSLVQVEWLLFQQDVQIRGVVFVLDFKGLSVYHITQYTPYFISKLLYLMQDCYPIRVKALYVIHNPALFDILFAAAKRFMKPKLLQRVRLLGHDLVKLHNLLPADVIPKEAGGTHEFYDYDKLEKDLQSKAKFFDEISRYGYRTPISRGR
ncbi:alpha-tocopherol transfer protein-like isoform X2 [Dermacentor variabilis]|uniref:alpha-tocopherol transfer protein-like isoform X2 n=1 Tax=Dermacentor variabilis TaxID=34621 RepID=UPI003F5AE4B6